jgi:hypothetical protein
VRYWFCNKNVNVILFFKDQSPHNYLINVVDLNLLFILQFVNFMMRVKTIIIDSVIVD